MTPEPCRHPNRAEGVVDLDISRKDDSADGIYTTPVCMSICEDCGRIELSALLPHFLCDWLRRN
jgi:hypothetical protein